MTATYSDYVRQVEQEKDEIVCHCKNAETFKPKTLYVLPSGGFSATLYTLGVMKSLFESGLLMTEDNEFNKENMFIGSSGGSLVLFLVLSALHLKLHIKEPKHWFKLYVEPVFAEMKPYILAKLYIMTQVRSFVSEKLANCVLDDWSYQIIDSITNNVVTDEFKLKKGIDFLNDELSDYFRLNYIKVVNGNTPYMTDNNKDLTGMSILEQFKTMFSSCCTMNGLSYARYFQNHDAGVTLNNYINCLQKYLDNKYIRNILYYTTLSYDKFSYKENSNKNTILNYSERCDAESNYFYIQTIGEKCKTMGKNFCLINPPNKFNAIRKFNVPLYNDLQQRIYYEADFMDIPERFLGNYFLHNGLDMRRVVTLFGYYETLYILKEINAFNKKKQRQFSNIKFEVLNTMEFYNGKVTNDTTRPNLFKLTPDEIKQAVAFIKYTDNLMETIFENYCGCREKSAAFLTEYLTMMQGFQSEPNVKIKYNELFPITKMKRKVVRNPEKYLDKEYKRVSKDIVNIYFPPLSEKLKNIVPFN
jgi:hypothetical protein